LLSIYLAASFEPRLSLPQQDYFIQHS